MYVTVITGASSGIGEQFARQLAMRKHNLVLVARSGEKLESLCQELVERCGIEATPMVCDLAQPHAAAKVADLLKERGMQPRWLINNAGFGIGGDFDSLDLERTSQMIMLNVLALTELTHLLLPQLRLGRGSAVINVASTAAFQPVPWMSVYAATKAYVLSFSEGLAEELRKTDVAVVALCPGPVSTNFAAAGELSTKAFDKGQTAEEVATMGIHAAETGRVVRITDKGWVIALQRLVPRPLLRWIAGRISRRMFLKKEDG